MSFSTSHWAQGLSTTFTNASNNLLWGDAGNWSNGVPGSGDGAIFPTAAPGAIDLGGLSRQVESIRFIGDGHQLGNGSLAASRITATGTALVTANLTAPTFRDITFSGPGLTVAGTIFGDGPVRGTAIFTGANTYTGRTSVSTLTLANAGSAAASAAWDLTAGRLAISYGAAGEVNKLGDAAPITMFRTDLSFHNGSGAQVTESIGTITLHKSANNIKLTTTDSAAGTMNVTLPTIVRDDFASALLDVNPGQGTRLVPTGARNGGQNNLIYGWLMGVARPSATSTETRLSFITYSDSRGLRPLDLATEYNNSIDGSITDVRLTAPQAVNSSTAAHSLVLHGAGVQLNGAQLNLSTGALALSTDASASAEILAFGGTGTLSTAAPEMHVWTDAYASNTHRYRVDVPIQASQLTKSGPGALILSKPNTITGPIRINDGTLVAAAQGALGSTSTPLLLRQGATIGFQSESQSHGTLTMDSFFFDESHGVLSFAHMNVASGIVATFDHVAGTGGLSKYGGGRLRITGDSSPAGVSISVIDGSLQIDRTYQNVPINLPDGATLFESLSINGTGTATVLGSGTIVGRINISIAPGVDAPGQLTVGTISTSTGPSSINIELAGATPMTEYDRLVVLSGTRLTGRSLDVDLLNGFTPALGSQFTIIDDRFAGGITGTFNGLAQDAVFFADGRAFQINYLGGDGNDVVLTAVVPEPASAFVIASGAVLYRRRRHHFCGKRSS
jgi:autotransporter-associated beta strand protein